MNFLSEQSLLVVKQGRIMAVEFFKDGSNDCFPHEPGFVPDTKTVAVFFKCSQLMAIEKDGHFVDPFETRIFV